MSLLLKINKHNISLVKSEKKQMISAKEDLVVMHISLKTHCPTGMPRSLLVRRIRRLCRSLYVAKKK
jgi:hypothetical protein